MYLRRRPRFSITAGWRRPTVASRWRLTAVAAATLTTALLILSPRPAVGQEPGQEELETIRERVTRLEAQLEALRSEYGSRLTAIEEQLEALRQQGAAGAPEAAEQERAAEERQAGEERRARQEQRAEAEERAALEAEIAAILDESGEEEQEQPAAGGRTQQGEQRFGSRTRNLNRLNPEISVAGDIVGRVADRTGDEEVNKFSFDEFELAFQSTLDPYSMAKAFVVQEEGEFEVEEAYIDYTSLPGGIGLKVGQFRYDWGKINRWHQHALPQVDRPWVHQAVWGEGGVKGLGASFSWLAPSFLGTYNEINVHVTNDDNDVSFSGRGFDEPVFMIHETNYFDIDAASYVELGLSAATGVNDPAGEFRTQVYGLDWNYAWQPPARALYQAFELKGELLWQRKDGAEGLADTWGAYTYGVYKFDRRWSAGLRGDWTQIPEEPGESLWGLSPYVEWWQSEWARLRFQYSYNSRQLEEAVSESRFFFQIVWALGPHKHEKY